MEQKFSLLKSVSKRTCSWIALALLILCGFFLGDLLWGSTPPSSLKTWELAAALVLSLQIRFSSSLEALIRSLLPAHLFREWISSLIQACLVGLLLLLLLLLTGSTWNHVIFTLNGPAVFALVAAMLIMMGIYISGRFSCDKFTPIRCSSSRATV